MKCPECGADVECLEDYEDSPRLATSEEVKQLMNQKEPKPGRLFIAVPKY